MQPVTPFWFNMRQGKAQPAGDEVLRLTAPNLPEAFITVRKGENGLWAGAMRTTQDGPDVVASHPVYEQQSDAWYAAFELYRNQVVI